MFFGSKTEISTDEKEVDRILDRGVIVEFLPTKEEFKKRLLSGERLRMYWGFDATADTLHLSHAKNLILLEEFRKLGHEVIMLFGDFTARIGDPTGKGGAREQLTREEVLKNVDSWKRQIKPLMDFSDKKNPPKIMYNHDWLSELSFEDVLGLAAETTVQHMIERDMFEKRLKEGKPISLHEFLYPLMQGYDSVAMDVDVEFCGTDQTFNALMGRTLMRKRLNKEKSVVVVNLMENPKTGELMSKSRGTGVFLNTDANTMFGQIMAQPDEMMEPLFVNVTRVPLNEIKALLASNNPKETKLNLAENIVSLFYGETTAQKAKENFESTFSKGEVPEDTKVCDVKAGETLADALVRCGTVSSKTEFRRLQTAGAIKIAGTDEKVTEESEFPESGTVLRVGKHRFVKIVK